MRILVVEDDPACARLLEQILSLHGHEVAVAPTLSDALRELDTNPATILLDVLLPDGNGLDLLQKIRAEKRPITVAVLTATYRADWLARAATLRAEGLFLKPLDVYQLLTWLRDPPRIVWN